MKLKFKNKILMKIPEKEVFITAFNIKILYFFLILKNIEKIIEENQIQKYPDSTCLKEFFEKNDFEKIKKEYESFLIQKNTEQINLLKPLLLRKKDSLVKDLNISFSRKDLQPFITNFELLHKFNLLFSDILNEKEMLKKSLEKLNDYFRSSCMFSNETRMELNKVKSNGQNLEELKEKVMKNYESMELICKMSSDLKLNEEKEFTISFNDFKKQLKNALNNNQKKLASLNNSEQKLIIMDFFFVYSDLIQELNKNCSKDLILEYYEIKSKFNN